MVDDNRSLAEFSLKVYQICQPDSSNQNTFSVDENGMLTVEAKSNSLKFTRVLKCLQVMD